MHFKKGKTASDLRVFYIISYYYYYYYRIISYYYQMSSGATFVNLWEIWIFISFLFLKDVRLMLWMNKEADLKTSPNDNARGLLTTSFKRICLYHCYKKGLMIWKWVITVCNYLFLPSCMHMQKHTHTHSNIYGKTHI